MLLVLLLLRRLLRLLMLHCPASSAARMPWRIRTIVARPWMQDRRGMRRRGVVNGVAWGVCDRLVRRTEAVTVPWQAGPRKLQATPSQGARRRAQGSCSTPASRGPPGKTTPRAANQTADSRGSPQPWRDSFGCGHLDSQTTGAASRATVAGTPSNTRNFNTTNQRDRQRG